MATAIVFIVALSLAPQALCQDSPRTQDAPSSYRDSAGTVMRLASEEDRPFLRVGEPALPGSRLRRAVERFPDVRSCLAEGEGQKAQPDLTEFDWRRLTSVDEAEVCVFRIAASYADANGFEKWMRSQGFSHTYRLTLPGGKLIVHGEWPITGPKILLGLPISKRLIPMTARHLGVAITYQDGEVWSAHVSYSVL